MYNINIKTHICLKRGVNKADAISYPPGVIRNQYWKFCNLTIHVLCLTFYACKFTLLVTKMITN